MADSKKINNSFILAGQVTKNEWVMFFQNVKMILMPLLIISTICYGILFFFMTDQYDRYLWGKYYQSSVHIDSFNNQDNKTFSFKYPGGKEVKAYPIDIVNAPTVIEAYERVNFRIGFCLILGLLTTAIGFIGIVGFFKRKGESLSEERVIDGLKPIESLNDLKNLVLKENEEIGVTSKYQIVGVPFYDNNEVLHIGVSGNTGQGKTQIMIPLVEQIIENDHKAIVYDKARAFVKFFYNADKDILLNPLDDRSPPWNIHAEAETAADYDSIFEAMIPLPNNSEPYWNLAARTVASKTALRHRQSGEYRMSEFLSRLYNTTLEEIAAMLEGTEAGALIDMDNPKAGESIRSVMTTYIKCLGYCYDEPVYDKVTGTQDLSNLFSITKWVKDDSNKGLIYITSQGNQSAILKPLITTFFNISIIAGMSLEASRERRIFVMLDEIPSLNKLPSIVTGAAELRQFGFCFVAGWQLYSQLEEVYGVTGAKSISGLLTTRIQFNAGVEPYNIDNASKQFGSYRVEVPDEGLSFGVGPFRDGASLKFKELTRRCVTNGDIECLPKLSGYIKTAGGMFPVAKFTHAYYEPETVCQGMILRPMEELALGQQLVINGGTINLEELIRSRIERKKAEKEQETTNAKVPKKDSKKVGQKPSKTPVLIESKNEQVSSPESKVEEVALSQTSDTNEGNKTPVKQELFDPKVAEQNMNRKSDSRDYSNDFDLFG